MPLPVLLRSVHFFMGFSSSSSLFLFVEEDRLGGNLIVRPMLCHLVLFFFGGGEFSVTTFGSFVFVLLLTSDVVASDCVASRILLNIYLDSPPVNWCIFFFLPLVPIPLRLVL